MPFDIEILGFQISKERIYLRNWKYLDVNVNKNTL